MLSREGIDIAATGMRISMPSSPIPAYTQQEQQREGRLAKEGGCRLPIATKENGIKFNYTYE